MNTYITAYGTDIGTKKKVNQDSLCVKIAVVKDKTVCMAVLCDGMGGLSKGELASATVVQGFSDWFMKTLPYTDGKVSLIKEQWENLIVNLNGKIWNYGKKHEVELGTTLTVILLIDYKQYIIAAGGRFPDIQNRFGTCAADRGSVLCGKRDKTRKHDRRGSINRPTEKCAVTVYRSIAKCEAGFCGRQSGK